MHDLTDEWIDGSYVDETNNNLCVAINGARGTANGGVGSGVYAHARCCNITSSVTCQSNEASEVSGDGSISTSTCPSSYPFMLGCSAVSGWNAIDGLYTNPMQMYV